MTLEVGTVELPRDCLAVTKRGSCTAPTRWVLVSVGEEPLEWTVCNVHRAGVVEHLLPNPSPAGWSWADRVTGGVHPAHAWCLEVSSSGRRQTCRGAGSESRVVCPLTTAPRSGIPCGPD
jgi:hypothetical protein